MSAVIFGASDGLVFELASSLLAVPHVQADDPMGWLAMVPYLGELLGRASPTELVLVAAVVLGVAFIAGGVSSRREGRSSRGWTTGSPLPQPEDREALQWAFEQARLAQRAGGPLPLRAPEMIRVRQRVRDVPQAIRYLGGKDSDFSVPVFEDFLDALYRAANERRGTGRLHDLAPYFAHSAEITYRALGAARVEAVVVNTITEAAIFAISSPVREIEAQIVIAATYVETDHEGVERRYTLNELWTMLRSPDVASRAPEKAKVIGCPGCGAELGAQSSAEPDICDPCRFCGVPLETRAFDWRVVDIRVRYREQEEVTAFGHIEEIGTDNPTVIDDQAMVGLEALQQRDPLQTWPAFVARVVLVFQTHQEAWSRGVLTPLRPLLTDTLYEGQRRYLEALTRRGLKRTLVDGRTSFIELARITRDRYYDSITVRVHASCLDFTTGPTGAIVAGSKSLRREYTEYWTLLRSVHQTGASKADLACPSCGADVPVNQAGRCEHCNVKITSGDFDWVLSRIEQDEVYRV